MALAEIQDYLKLVPMVNKAPQGYMWVSYDDEADTLYINFKKPSHATDNEVADKDVIMRYEVTAPTGKPLPSISSAILRSSAAIGRNRLILFKA